MKNYSFFLFFFLSFFLSANSQQAIPSTSFILRGSISGMDNQYMFLNYRKIDGNYTKDSVLVTNNKFQFKGNTCEPSIASITSDRGRLGVDNSNFTFFYMEAAKMSITLSVGKFREFKLTGSKAHNEELVLIRMNEPVAKLRAPFMKEYSKLGDLYANQKKNGTTEDSLKIISDKMRKLFEEMKIYSEKSFAIYKSFYKKYPNSFVTLNKLNKSVKSFSYPELIEYYNRMSTMVRNSLTGREFKISIDKLNKAVPGKVAPDFAAKELLGDSLSLSDFKGKYVLLDFWASWCVPCRAGNPELIKLYNKYKDRGVEFIGVSDDDRHQAEWKKAIKKDGIDIWRHILRGRISETNDTGDINNVYYIYSLPTKILIDPTGIIIARYGYGGIDEDEKKLPMQFEKLFGKN